MGPAVLHITEIPLLIPYSSVYIILTDFGGLHKCAKCIMCQYVSIID